MNYVGVVHLYGTSKWNDEMLIHKCITLKKGSWYGEYEIMTQMPSQWDLVVGGDDEINISKKPKGMPSDHILCYNIQKDRFMDILDEYPKFRSFILLRSVERRSYFNKVKADNLQVILFRKKQEQHTSLVEAL